MRGVQGHHPLRALKRLGARAAGALAALVLCGLCGCNALRGTEARPDAAASTAPPPEPLGLVARFVLRDADGAWERARRGAAGLVSVLPATAGELAARLLGADARLGAIVDGHGASFGVLVDRAPAGPRDPGDAHDLGWALALPLTADGAREAASLGRDAVASFGLTERAENGWRVFSRADPPLPAAVALAPGWLVLARDGAALTRLGPYLLRTLPADASLSAGGAARGLLAIVPHAGLAASVAPWLASAWGAGASWLLDRARDARAAHGGRAPDFGDPEAIVRLADAPVKRWIAALADYDALRVTLDAGDDDLALDVTGRKLAEPPPGSVGDGAPLAGLPASASLAALAWQSLPERLDGARAVAEALPSLFGPSVGEKDVRGVDEALEGLARARGRWVTAAIVGGESGAPGLLVRAPAADDAKGPGSGPLALRALLALSKREAIAGLLERTLRVAPFDLQATRTERSWGAFPRKPPSAGDPVFVGWGEGDDGVILAAAGEARAAMASLPARVLDGALPQGTWGDDPRTARAIAALGAEVSFAAVFRPSGGRSGPSLVAWGGQGAQRWARIDLADATLAEALRAVSPFP